MPTFVGMTELEFLWGEWSKIFHEVPKSNGQNVMYIVDNLLQKDMLVLQKGHSSERRVMVSDAVREVMPKEP